MCYGKNESPNCCFMESVCSTFKKAISAEFCPVCYDKPVSCFFVLIRSQYLVFCIVAQVVHMVNGVYNVYIERENKENPCQEMLLDHFEASMMEHRRGIQYADAHILSIH